MKNSVYDTANIRRACRRNVEVKSISALADVLMPLSAQQGLVAGWTHS